MIQPIHVRRWSLAWSRAIWASVEYNSRPSASNPRRSSGMATVKPGEDVAVAAGDLVLTLDAGRHHGHHNHVQQVLELCLSFWRPQLTIATPRRPRR